MKHRQTCNTTITRAALSTPCAQAVESLNHYGLKSSILQKHLSKVHRVTQNVPNKHGNNMVQCPKDNGTVW